MVISARFDEKVQGGESLIVDLWKVANDFRKSNPEDFEALCTIPATFQKIHYGRYVFMTYVISNLRTLKNIQFLDFN